MKHCEKLEQKISAYLDGELSDAEYDEIEAHLDSCAGCQEYYRELESAQNILRQNVSFELPPGVDKDRMWRNIESQITIPQPSFWERLKKKVVMPAVWVPAAVASAAVAMLFFISPVSKEMSPIQTASVEPPVQEDPVSVEPTPMEQAVQLSRIESVSSQSGQVMVLQTASTGQPIIWIIPTKEEGAKS